MKKTFTPLILSSFIFITLFSTASASSTVDLPNVESVLTLGTWKETDTSIYPRNLQKNVGIGTSSPQVTFDVLGNARVSQTLEVGDGNTGSLEISGAEAEFIIGTPTINSSNAGKIIFREENKDSFTWWNNGENDKLTLKSYDVNDIMVIKRSNGYVGIGGVTNPESPLSVGGVVESSGGFKLKGGGVTFSDGTTQTTAFFAHPADSFTTGEVANLRSNKLADATTPWTDKVSSSGGTFTGQVNFPYSGVWNSLGRVGIGEPNPQQALVVNGIIETYQGVKYADGTIQTTAYGVIPAQNFTETDVNNLKASKLTNGTTPWTSNMPLSGGIFTGNVVFAVDKGVWGSDGKVGIGTLSASQPLTVAGTIYSSTGGFMFPDGTIQTRAVPENLTGSRVMVTDTNGRLSTVGVTSSEVGLLSGLTVGASSINQALSGISAGVTGGNLSTLIGGGNTTLHTHQLRYGATDISASAGEINQALYGISSSVTASNLTTLTNGSTTTLHKHQLGYGATDVTASAAEINQVTDGVSSLVTASNLNTILGGSSVNADQFHYHSINVKVGYKNRSSSSPAENESITDCGFTPKYVKIRAIIDLMGNTDAPNSEGYAVSPSNQFAQYSLNSVGGQVYSGILSTWSIYISDAGNEWYGKILSFDSSGFTIQWTKTGTAPSFSYVYECYR